MHFDHLPFVPLYRTDDEFAAEISNQTVHGVMHLAWVPTGRAPGHEAQMAVYVKPRGRFGQFLYGVHQAVSVRDRLSRTRAPASTRVESSPNKLVPYWPSQCQS